MNAPFVLANRIFKNANDFATKYHTIHDYPPVEEFVKETGKWFSELADGDDESSRAIRMKVWQLRATVLYSLRPYDSEELRIEEQLLSLQRDVTYFPFLHERMSRLAKIAHFLLENPENPKRLKVFKLLQECADKGRDTGIVLALVRGSTPGWSKAVADEILEIAPYCEFIMGSKALKLKTYRQLILPASGRLSPIITDLYYGCRTKRLDVVIYKREGIYTPLRRSLPKGTYIKSKPLKVLSSSQQYEQEYDEAHLDQWAQRGFWETLRERLSGSVRSAVQDQEFFVRARIVILTDNKKVYLREDMNIIEISDLVEGQADFESYGKRYPRRRVDQLKEGDLIVLRTSGSGEYLVDFANALMKADGKENLRASALDWKPLLRQALVVHGSEKIAGLLNSRGHNLSNHRYIWMWTEDAVIRPQSQPLFQDLLNILSSLGYSLGEGDPFDAAARRWKRMKEFIRYHMMAGRRIRQALLERLRKMIQERVVITDSYHLSLPGLSAGEISVFRVAAVDTESIEIPYHHAGVITPLES